MNAINFEDINAAGWLRITAPNPDAVKEVQALDRIGNVVSAYENVGVDILGLEIICADIPARQVALEHPVDKAYSISSYIMILNSSKQYPVVFIRGGGEQKRICTHQWVDTGMSFTFCKHCNLGGRRTLDGITH